MSLFLTPQTPRDISRGFIESPTVGFQSFLGASFEQGWHDSIFASIQRMSELEIAKDYDPETNPYVNKDKANEIAKNQGLDLHFDEDPTVEEFSLLRQRKEKENARLIRLNAAEGFWKNAAGMGAGLLGSVANPLDLAVAFVPIVGTGGKALQAGKAAGVLGKGRIALNNVYRQGLIKSLTPATSVRGKLGQALLEGSAGSLLAEIPLAISNIQDQSNYTADNFFVNVAAGGVFNTALRSVFMAMSRMLRTVNPEIKDAMLGEATEQFLTDHDIRVHGYLEFDNKIQRARAKQELEGEGVIIPEDPKVREAKTELTNMRALEGKTFDVKSARQQALDSVESHEEFLAKFEEEATSGPLLDEPLLGSRDPYMYRVTEDYDVENIQSFGITSDDLTEGAGLFFSNDMRGTDYQQRFNDGFIIRMSKEKIIDDFGDVRIEHNEVLDEIELFDDEITIQPEDMEVLTADGWKLIEDVTEGEAIPARKAPTGVSREELELRAKEARQESIRSFVEEERAKFNAQKEGSAEKIKELEQIIEEGRLMQEDAISRNTKETPEVANKAREESILDDEIADLEDLLAEELSNAIDEATGVPRALKDLEEEDIKPTEAAIECLINNG